MVRKAKIKTIDINVKEWFDKTYGNSYFAGEIIINYGMKTEKTFNMPFQYGSGDHYKDMAFKLLCKECYFNWNDRHKSHIVYKENNIIVRSYKQENCKKRELNEF